MKKLLTILAAVLCLQGNVLSQCITNPGCYGGSGPVTSAQLAITSTTKGFLVPRMTTVNRDAIVTPATGLMVYNTTTSAFNFYSGAAWGAVGGSGTVTSVSGTANQIGSTGGATPVISLVSGGTLPGAWVLGTPTSATLTNATGLPEAGLTLADNTTNNTSTTAHGFFPKLTSNSIYYVSNAGALTALTVGASGTVLTGNGVTSAPTWTTPAAGVTGSGAANRIAYWSGASVLTSQTPNFTIDAVATGYLDVPVGLAIKGVKVGTITTIASGAYSTYFGELAAAAGTGNFNAAFGTYALNNNTAGASNTAVGYSALLNTLANENTGIGENSGSNATTGYGNTYVGFQAGICVNGVFSVAYVTGTNSTFIGKNTGASGNFNNVLCLGTGATASTDNTAVIGGPGVLLNGVPTNLTNIYFNGETYTTAAPIILNGCGGSGTNIAGANITIAGGKATGQAIPGNIDLQTGQKIKTTGTPTGLDTLGSRYTIIGKYTDLTESSPTAFTRINIPSGTVAGGVIIYTIAADDATDFQALTGTLFWAAVNKAGTTTVVLTDPADNLTTATSAVSTLTNTMTAVDATGGNVDFKAAAVSSLTQTTLRINCQVSKNFGKGTTIAQ